MGDIADAMLDGTLCEGCGEYIGSDAGFPQYCSPQCAVDRGVEMTRRERNAFAKRTTPHKCELCGKGFASTFSLDQHWRDKHGAAQ